MKKLIALILVFCMVPTFALACEDVVLVQKTEQAYVYHDVTYWAVTEEHHVAGMKESTECVLYLPIQSVHGEYVRGFAENGLIREACAVKIFCAEEKLVGLTALHNTVVIVSPEFYNLVSEIIVRRIGENTLVNAQSIIASTTWRIDNYITHIFFTSNMERFAVGQVLFNGGKDMTVLYAGDFDYDGLLELGFAPGWFEHIPEPEPEPTVKPDKSQSTPTMNPPVESKPCKKPCINIEINIGLFVKSCVRFLNSCAEMVKQ